MPAELTTPYATSERYADAIGRPQWAGEQEGLRLASYDVYEAMYFNAPTAFATILRTDDDQPIYLPTPKVVVDTTAHYLMKGLEVSSSDKKTDEALKRFLKREQFYSRFHTAKHSGVVRGDFIFHMTVDETKPAGSRLSLVSVDPAMYFPLWDPDDLNKLLGVRLVEQQQDENDKNKTVVRILDYWYVAPEGEEDNEEIRKVAVEENVWEMEGWNNPEKAKKLKTIRPPQQLPDEIIHIPVYHFKNIDWQGEPYGRSELQGLERVFAAINQSASDEDLALALMGIGVYVTDGGRPTDADGNEVDWRISPGSVLESPNATMFKKVEGVSSITPSLEHIEMLKEAVWESTGTSDVARGVVDAQTAESGIALSIRFMPTTAKLEQRDIAGVEKVGHIFHNWAIWHSVFEEESLPEDVEFLVTLGDKLPMNRAKKIEELNNMMDRRVVSREWYRAEMTKLGYVFPPTMEDDVLAEEAALAEARAQGPATLPTDKSENVDDPTLAKKPSNNREGSNESKGTEIDPNK